jgi:hypothetical protein
VENTNIRLSGKQQKVYTMFLHLREKSDQYHQFSDVLTAYKLIAKGLLEVNEKGQFRAIKAE